MNIDDRIEWTIKTIRENKPLIAQTKALAREVREVIKK